jgi:methylated-DNA-[protein]-cysteine S-methyltransferase
MPTAFALFATPIGSCAIAWGDHGIVALQLPETSEGASDGGWSGAFPPQSRLSLFRTCAAPSIW